MNNGMLNLINFSVMYYSKIVFITVFLVSWLGMNSQVVINEVCSRNDSVISDQSGEFSDWIELYNTTDQPISLNGYYLSDNPAKPHKWKFGDVNISPFSYLLVFASGEDVKDFGEVSDTISGLSDDYWVWSDSKHTITPGESTIEPLLYEEIRGEEDNKTIYSAKMYVGDNYSAGELGWYSTFVNIYVGESGKSYDYSQFDKLQIEATISEGRDIQVRLVQKGVDNWLGYPYTITGTGIEKDLYEIPLNDSWAIDNLSDLSAVKYEALFPEGYTEFTIYNQFWIDRPRYLQASFKLSGDGESVLLSDSSAKIIDNVNFPELDTDFSYGRATDGTGEFALFPQPTPLKSNNDEFSYSGICKDRLHFSIDAGFYNGEQILTISGSDEIRYTIDGTDPRIENLILEGSYSIDSTIVFKAACFEGNSYPLNIYTNTYIIDEPATLPVFSISTDPDNLFGHENGIYANGPNWTPVDPHKGANFWEDWERPVYVEFFDETGKFVFEQEALSEIFGGWSRVHPMKSLKLKARKKLGAERFDYKFFNSKTNASFKQIVLRNSGNDFNISHFHDAINHEIAIDFLDVDLQAFQPSIVFINGQYWGIHNIRENVNDNYIEDNHGINADTIELFNYWGGRIGDGEFDLNAFFETVMDADMTDSNEYNTLIETMDFENFIDIFAVNAFNSNWDWPQNNLKVWYSPKTEKIRYIMYDTDVTYGLHGYQDHNFNQIKRLVAADGIGPHADMFSQFIQNPSFRNAFINRSADIMNTNFSAANLYRTIDSLKAIIEPEMPKHRERWGGSMEGWNDSINRVKDWIGKRMPVAFDQLQNEFQLTKQIDITLSVIPEDAGTIKINSVIPQTLPWTGTYFDGVPVTITAVPNPGFTFEYWERSVVKSVQGEQSFSVNLTEDESFIAHFEGVSESAHLVVSEINYHSSASWDTGDWFELYNAGSQPVDLTLWKINDKNDYSFYSFPDNTVIEPDEYIVFSSDKTKFKLFYDSIPVEDIPFNLSNSGDILRLFDAKGNLYYQMEYSDEGEWPSSADGGGYTLELESYTSNPNLASSWFEGCEYGSPGKVYKVCEPEVTEYSEVDSEVTSEVKVIPNPAYNYLKITGVDNSHCNINVSNVLGKEVLHLKDFNTAGVLNIKDLPIGIYFISVATGDLVSGFKFVKR